MAAGRNLMEPHTSTATRRPRPSTWFFLLLAVLAVAAVVIPIVYNLSLQLRPEELALAKERWREHAPRDYDLEYRFKLDDDPEAAEDRYRVAVRAGRVVLAGCNREVLLLDPRVGSLAGVAVRAVPGEDAHACGVEALFEQIETALRQDETSGRRNYATASFDPADGHPLRFIHRVSGTRQRIEFHVKLKAVSQR